MLDILKSRFIGTHELRKSLTSILDDLAKEGSEVIITRQGKPTAVLIHLETYLEMQQALREFSDPGYLASLLDARREIREGQGVPAETVFRQRQL